MARIGVRSEELRQQAMDGMGIFLDEAARTYEETEESLRAAAGR